jgi:tetratricopeptide (TPR) repeat protein
MGSLSLGKGEFREAELYLRKAADAEKPVPLALNDLAEVLRRNRNYDEAEKYARLAVKAAPKLYVAWETLGSILLGAERNLKEAEECIKKACELSKGENGVNEDVRMLVSLARVQLKTGDVQRAKGTIRKVQNRINELSDFERSEFEDMRKGVK